MLRMPVGTVIRDAETGETLADLARTTASGRCSPRAAPGGSATCTSSRAPTARRASSPAACPARRASSRSSCACSPTWGCSGCPTRASRPSSARCRRRARRSPTTRSRRCTRTWAWCASTRAARFVVADIPGLIAGAAEGAGLGHQFLRHLQRTRLLLHLVDMAPFDTAADPAAEVRALAAELKRYDPALAKKPRWLVFNKVGPPRAGRARAAGEGAGAQAALDPAVVRDLRDQGRGHAASSPSGSWTSSTPERARGSRAMSVAARRGPPGRREDRLEPAHQRGRGPRPRGDRRLGRADRAAARAGRGARGRVFAGRSPRA